MFALVLQETHAPLMWQERPNLSPGPGEAVVALKCSSLNRRDYWITQGMYPGIEPPVVLGSDGAGVVREIGQGVEESWRAGEVIINPGLRWGESSVSQAREFHILGLPTDGTFATEVCVPAEQLHRKPQHMTWQEASALPLAGVTAFRAVFTQGELKAGETMLVSGIGGGVATFALQFGVAVGAEVWVTSSSPEKIEQAVELGAKGGFLYTDENWAKQAAEEMAPNLIIDSAGGKGYASLLQLAAPGGRIVNYGATAGPPEKLDMFKLFWKQLRLIGSTMGSPADFAGMLQFVADHQIQPIIDEVFPLQQTNEALARMKSSPQFGKYVLEIESAE